VVLFKLEHLMLALIIIFIIVANQFYVLKKNNKMHCKTVRNNGTREIKR
jgi:hypothetical protein